MLQHIASCDTCFSEYEALVREFAPGGLHDATPSSRPLRTGPARPAAIAALAAAAAIIVVAGWGSSTERLDVALPERVDRIPGSSSRP